MEKIFDVKFEIYSNFKINKTNTKIIKRAVNDLNERLKLNEETKNVSFEFNNFEEVINDVFESERVLDYITSNSKMKLNIDNEDNIDNKLIKLCDDRLNLFSVNYIKHDNTYMLTVKEEETSFNVDFIISDIKLID
jgi:hypothetical protein